MLGKKRKRLLGMVIADKNDAEEGEDLLEDKGLDSKLELHKALEKLGRSGLKRKKKHKGKKKDSTEEALKATNYTFYNFVMFEEFGLISRAELLIFRDFVCIELFIHFVEMYLCIYAGITRQG